MKFRESTFHALRCMGVATPNSLGRGCESALLSCARGRLLPRRIPKQQRRSDKQRDEEPSQPQDLYRRAPREDQPEDQHDHGDQRLRERRREQRACHSGWPQARDDGTDDPDGEHPDIQHVGVVVLTPMMPTAPVNQTRRNAAASATPTANRYAILPAVLATSTNVTPVPKMKTPAITKSARVQAGAVNKGISNMNAVASATPPRDRYAFLFNIVLLSLSVV